MPERRKAPRAGVEDFFPWVTPISSLPPVSEEEEQEDKMADPIHNFGARKRKQGASFKGAADVTAELADDAGQPASGEDLDMQAIVISGLPEMGFHGQLALETTLSVDSGEVTPAHAEVREDNPPE